MNIFKLERTQVLPITLEKAWEYFSNPKNLSELTPSDLSLGIVSEVPATIYNGLMIQYTVKPVFGISLPWVTEIKHVNEPLMFVDEQRVGPYAFWYHQHFFKQVPDGVEVKDIVHYSLPLGFMAGILNTFLVRNKLEKIFNYRSKVLKNKF